MSYKILANGNVMAPPRELPNAGEYDVVVCGGGMAGFGAALAAARHSASVLIIEKATALGGLATVGLVPIPMDTPAGISAEMIRRLEEVDGHVRRNSDPEKHKLILDRMVKEANIDVLLDTMIVDAVMEGNQVRGVVVESKSGTQVIMGKRFIDCTGDADLAFFAGCECMSGRSDDGKHQACSLDFRLGGVDYAKYVDSDFRKKDPRWIKLIEEAHKDGRMPIMFENHVNWQVFVPGRPKNCAKDEIVVCISHSRNCDPLSNRDLTRMYQEGREQAEFFSKFIRENVPGYENSYLIDTANLLGVRESRRVVGEYILKTLDFARGSRFDDAITATNHHFDLHNPDGVGNIKWAKEIIDGKVCYVSSTGNPGSLEPPCGYENMTDGWGRQGADRVFKKTASDIPYRSLVPVKIDNLLVAGRCLSSEFMAQAASRLILCCCNMGQAAGTAAVQSLKENTVPRKIDIKALQAQLAKDRA